LWLFSKRWKVNLSDNTFNVSSQLDTTTVNCHKAPNKKLRDENIWNIFSTNKWIEIKNGLMSKALTWKCGRKMSNNYMLTYRFGVPMDKL